MSRPTNLAYLDDYVRPALGKGASLLMDYPDLMEWNAVLLGAQPAHDYVPNGSGWAVIAPAVPSAPRLTFPTHPFFTGAPGNYDGLRDAHVAVSLPSKNASTSNENGWEDFIEQANAQPVSATSAPAAPAPAAPRPTFRVADLPDPMGSRGYRPHLPD